MQEGKRLYEVSRFGNRKTHIYAENSTKAKRAYCKAFGFRFNDPWCGASTLSARALTPAEVEAREARAGTERETYLFIKGMLDITAKAYADARGGAAVEG